MFKNKIALYYVSLFSVFWAFAILGQKYVIKNGYDPLTLAPTTLLLSTLMLGVYLILSKTYQIKNTSTKSIFGVIVSGIIGGGLANFASIYGLKFTTSLNAGFILKTSTAFTVLFAYLLLKEPISKLKFVLVLVLLAGAYLLSTGGNSITPHSGDLYLIFAAIGFAFASVLNRLYIKRDIHPDLVSFFRALFGTVITSGIVLVLGHPLFSFDMFPIVLIISFFQAGVYIYLNKTLSVASASYMTMVSMATPVVVALFAIPLFGESLNTLQWCGAFLIIFSGIMTQVKRVVDHD